MIDPDGRYAYWLTLNDESQGGVWRADIETGQIERLLVPAPTASRSGIVLAAVIEPLGKLALSDDGRRLAILECQRGRCVLRVLELSTGLVQEFSVEGSGQELRGFATGGEAVDLGYRCVVLASGQVTSSRACRRDEATARAEIAFGFSAGVELPSGWSLDMSRAPGSAPMSFELVLSARSRVATTSIRLAAQECSSDTGEGLARND